MTIATSTPSFRGAIFDVDGTLIDSNDAHASSWVEVMRAEGHEVSFEKVRPLIGMGGDKLLPAVLGISESSPEGKKMSERRGEIFREKHFPKLQVFPGVRELFLRMKEAGVKFAIATSAPEKDMRMLLKKCQIDDLVGEQKTSSDDADRSKPDPDIVEASLELVGLPAGEVLMIGDTPYDLIAGRRAGIGSVAFRCGGWWKDADFREAGWIYDGPAHLLREFDRSPFAPQT